MHHRRAFLIGLSAIGLAGACSPPSRAAPQQASPPDVDLAEPFATRIAIGAELRALKPETYDASYVKLPYPMGDVADNRGVCADTVIRAFRHAGVDLQVEMHEDMAANFGLYPKNWGLKRPDKNIDHRRVPNLETLFKRKGGAKEISRNARDYLAGDIVSWRLSGTSLPHIGVVTRKVSGGEPLIAHNIGYGTRLEPVLFNWTISGWFRFSSWT